MKYHNNTNKNFIGHILVELAKNEKGIFYYIDAFFEQEIHMPEFETILPAQIYNLIERHASFQFTVSQIEDELTKSFYSIKKFSELDPKDIQNGRIATNSLIASERPFLFV